MSIPKTDWIDEVRFWRTDPWKKTKSQGLKIEARKGMIWNEQATEGKGQENRSTVQMRSLSFLQMMVTGETGWGGCRSANRRTNRGSGTGSHGCMVTWSQSPVGTESPEGSGGRRPCRRSHSIGRRASSSLSLSSSSLVTAKTRARLVSLRGCFLWECC